MPGGSQETKIKALSVVESLVRNASTNSQQGWYEQTACHTSIDGKYESAQLIQLNCQSPPTFSAHIKHGCMSYQMKI